MTRYLALEIAHIAWLWRHGFSARASGELRQVLYAWRDHPGMLAAIHRAVYAINPDWGL